MNSWKKCIEDVYPPIWGGMASGCKDMTLAKAAINATKAMIFVFLIFQPLP
jgi:hypothetical protein